MRDSSSFLLLWANYQATDSPTLLTRLKNRGKKDGTQLNADDAD